MADVQEDEMGQIFEWLLTEAKSIGGSDYSWRPLIRSKIGLNAERIISGLLLLGYVCWEMWEVCMGEITTLAIKFFCSLLIAFCLTVEKHHNQTQGSNIISILKDTLITSGNHLNPFRVKKRRHALEVNTFSIEGCQNLVKLFETHLVHLKEDLLMDSLRDFILALHYVQSFDLQNFSSIVSILFVLIRICAARHHFLKVRLLHEVAIQLTNPTLLADLSYSTAGIVAAAKKYNIFCVVLTLFGFVSGSVLVVATGILGPVCWPLIYISLYYLRMKRVSEDNLAKLITKGLLNFLGCCIKESLTIKSIIHTIISFMLTVVLFNCWNILRSHHHDLMNLRELNYYSVILIITSILIFVIKYLHVCLFRRQQRLQIIEV